MTSASGRIDMASETTVFATSLSLAEAQTRIIEIASKSALSDESILLETALGRVLAQDVRAPHDVPSFVNSAMDGYAVRFVDLRPEGETALRLSGVMLAGGENALQVEAGRCVRITTG